MNLNSMQLYQQMQDDIEKSAVNCTCEMLMIENCFTITMRYWNNIKQRLDCHLFSNETEEIDFFKNIKPLFIAAIEYYTLYYQAMLFKPSHDTAALTAYWMQQLKRVETFYNRHRDFYQYYTSGQTCNDNFYFIRRNNICDSTSQLFSDNKPSISYDHIAARIIGYQRYLAYVKDQLEILLRLNRNKLQRQFYEPVPLLKLNSGRFSLANRFIAAVL